MPTEVYGHKVFCVPSFNEAGVRIMVDPGEGWIRAQRSSLNTKTALYSQRKEIGTNKRFRGE